MAIWRDQMHVLSVPVSRLLASELGDRNARAGAAPGRVPVRGRRRCVTALVQEFSQDSAVAWPRPGLSPDPSSTRPIVLASTRSHRCDAHDIDVRMPSWSQPSDSMVIGATTPVRDRSGRCLIPSPSHVAASCRRTSTTCAAPCRDAYQDVSFPPLLTTAVGLGSQITYAPPKQTCPLAAHES